MAKTYEIKIGATTLSGLKKYEVEPGKLWTDADRNLKGELKATFLGVYPKIALEFNYLSESEMKILVGLLDPPSISVEFWDTYSGSYKTANYYAGDFKIPYYSREKELYSPFSVNLIPYQRLR